MVLPDSLAGFGRKGLESLGREEMERCRPGKETEGKGRQEKGCRRKERWEGKD